MSKATVREVEALTTAIEDASHWYNCTIRDQTTDYIIERLRLHKGLPHLIEAANAHLDEIQGIIERADEKDNSK